MSNILFLSEYCPFDLSERGADFVTPRGAQGVTVQDPKGVELVFFRGRDIAKLPLTIKRFHDPDDLFGVLLFDEIIIVAANNDSAVLKPDYAVKDKHNAALVGIEHNVAFLKLCVPKRCNVYNIPVFPKKRLHASAAGLERHFVGV